MHKKVEDVKNRVLVILSKEPQLNRIFSNSIVALLKIRKLRDYMIKSLSILQIMGVVIEHELRRDAGRLEEISYELLELENSIAAFGYLTDDEAKTLQDFFTELNPKRVDSLEAFMCERLGLVSRKFRDPDRESSDGDKFVSVATAVLKSEEGEDFTLVPPRKIKNSEIEKMIREYYGNDDCIVRKDYILGAYVYTVRNNKEQTRIAVTNGSEELIVTVAK